MCALWCRPCCWAPRSSRRRLKTAALDRPQALTRRLTMEWRQSLHAAQMQLLLPRARRQTQRMVRHVPAIFAR
jgi:hypothetical protein